MQKSGMKPIFRLCERFYRTGTLCTGSTSIGYIPSTVNEIHNKLEKKLVASKDGEK